MISILLFFINIYN